MSQRGGNNTKDTSQVALVVEPACQCRRRGDAGSIPGSGRSPGGGHGDPLQYSCLENPKDTGAWWVTDNRVTKNRTWLKWLSRHNVQRRFKCVHFTGTPHKEAPALEPKVRRPRSSPSSGPFRHISSFLILASLCLHVLICKNGNELVLPSLSYLVLMPNMVISAVKD